MSVRLAPFPSPWPGAPHRAARGILIQFKDKCKSKGAVARGGSVQGAAPLARDEQGARTMGRQRHDLAQAVRATGMA